jgi:hypothetical protein
MAKLGKIFLLAIAFCALAVALSFFTNSPVNATSTSNVNVVNTTANPVPISAQGTTAIAGTVNLASGATVGISGMPTVNLAPGTAVGITGTPSVTPSNTNTTPLFVRGADNPANEPLHMELCLSVGAFSTLCANNPNTFTVPTTTSDGKAVERLVIESVSGNCLSTSTQVAFIQLLVPLAENTNDSIGFNEFPISSSFTNSGNGNAVQAYAQQMTIYGDPGSTVSLGIGLVSTGSGYGSSCNALINGHLVTQ